MSERELPRGWVMCTFDDVCQIISGKNQKQIFNENGKYPIYGSGGIMGYGDDFLCGPGTTIIGRKGTINSPIFVEEKFWNVDTAFGLSPRDFYNNKLFFYFCLSFNFKNLDKSTTIPSLAKTDLLQIPIPLPPLAEQQRIVARIEELFSGLDQGVQALKTAQQQLKLYRQAVLKWAFEGRLTEEWRSQQIGLPRAETLVEQIREARALHHAQVLSEWKKSVISWEIGGKKGRKPNKPKVVEYPDSIDNELFTDFPELPQGWVYIHPSEVASCDDYSIGIGPFGSNLKVSDYKDSGIPLIFVRNITSSNFMLGRKYISTRKYEELTPHSINPLDILITKMGDPPGDCAIYPENFPVAVITADCLKFRVWDKFANRKYFKYCIESGLIKKQLGLITQGVAQKKISSERFKSLVFPLPSLPEQHAIVAAIESRLSVCDKLEESITQSLAQAEALRQSILKKAFEGRLVPQDPNDEPAAALLARIQAERAGESTTRKKRIS